MLHSSQLRTYSILPRVVEVVVMVVCDTGVMPGVGIIDVYVSHGLRDELRGRRQNSLWASVCVCVCACVCARMCVGVCVLCVIGSRFRRYAVGSGKSITVAN